MLHIDSDIERIKNSAKKISTALIELPGWTKALLIALPALAAINWIVNIGEAFGRAIYYLSH